MLARQDRPDRLSIGFQCEVGPYASKKIRYPEENDHWTGEANDSEGSEGHEDDEARVHRRFQKWLVFVLGCDPCVDADIERDNANHVNPDLGGWWNPKDRQQEVRRDD